LEVLEGVHRGAGVRRLRAWSERSHRAAGAAASC
jgi:hypothetical protein